MQNAESFKKAEMTAKSRLTSRSLLAVIAAFTAPSAIAAQVPDTTRADTTRIQELEVRAIAPVLTVGGASGLRVRIDSLPLPSAPTLEQVLRQLPALHVRRNSRGEAELSVRGSDSRQVAVLVDGVPINLAWDARADVSVIPAAGLQEVRFVRGLSSMLYGPNTLGGIVEISVGHSSYRPTAATAELSSGLDHLGGFGAAASASVPLIRGSAHWLVRGGLSYRDIPGFPLARGITEPLPTDNNLRANTDSRSINGFTALRYEGAGGEWLSFSGSSFRAERGIAAELGYDNARFWRYPHLSRTVAVLSGGTGDRRSPFGGRGDLETRFGLDRGRTEIDTYTSRTYSELAGFEDGNDRTLTFRLLGDQTLGSRADLRAAFTVADIRHDEFLPTASPPPSSPDHAVEARYRQRLFSLGAESIWRVLENRGKLNVLRLSVGGAYDVGQTPETGGREPGQPTVSEWGARLGLTAVLLDGYLLAHGGVSRRGRFPSLRELYSDALDRYVPNPELRPENLVAAEAGVTVRIGEATQIQTVGFRHHLNDAVVRITLPDPAQRFKRVNRDRLTSTGVELLASTTVGRMDLRGDLTFQSVRLTNPEAGNTGRPENLPEVFGGAAAGYLFPLGIHAVADLRFTGNQFCLDPATGNETELPAGAVVSAGVSREWRIRASGSGLLSRIETRVAVDNVGDKALYGQCRLPEPGRLGRFQIRIF